MVERLSYTQLVRSSNLFSCIHRAYFPTLFGKQTFLVYRPIFNGLRSSDIATKIAASHVGGAAGTAIGAAVGSCLGPVGTVVGAAAGGFVGSVVAEWVVDWF